MFGKGVTLFRLLGFEVRLDASWIIIALLLTWSLAQGYFPHLLHGLPAGAYWAMGVAGAVGLFISIVVHEFSHSLVARSYGLQMRGITLFIFGGVAEMQNEPASPKVEFWMAIAGPITSVLLGILFYLLEAAAHSSGAPPSVQTVLLYLGEINLILALFNLIPAFPLDGGRVLRSALWAGKHNLLKATRIASRIGAGFGYLMMAVGVWAFFTGRFIGGVWWFLIGAFLTSASQMSYRRMLMQSTLQGEPVARFMRADPVAIEPSLDLQHLVDDYIYRYHYRMFPVVEDGQLRGCVNVSRLKQLDRSQWPQHRVAEIMQPCSPQNTVTPQTGAMEALNLMTESGNRRLLVADQGRLVAIITLRDLIEFLALKLKLEAPA